MLLHRITPAIRATALALAGASLAAADFDAGAAGELQIHGFASQGALKSDDNNYLTNDTERGTVDFNEFGLAISDRVSDQLSVGAQLFARDLGTEGQDQVGLDWAYGDYRWRDELGVRAGIIHTPLGLYSEDRDIDLARTEILLPQLFMYNENYRDVLDSFIGAEFYGDIPAARAGSLDYEIFGGSNQANGQNNSVRDKLDDGNIFNLTTVGFKDLWGGQLNWITPLTGLRLGGTYEQIDWDDSGTANLPTPPTGAIVATPMHSDNRTAMEVASAEYTWHDLLLASEYCHARNTFVNSLVPLSTRVAINAGWYVLGSWRFNRWLAASAAYTDVHLYGSAAALKEVTYEHDTELAMRFDLDPHWLFKLEGHYIVGDGLLLQNNNPTEVNAKNAFHPDQHWWLAAAKTTFSF